MKEKLKKVCMVLLGSAVQAFGLYNIHAVSGVTEGGILGLTLLLWQWFEISPALSSLVINALCYLFGFFVLGKGFIMLSVAAGIGFSVIYRVLEFRPPIYPAIADMPFLTPSAVLVIQGGETKLVNVKNQDSMTKILDMIPGFVDKFSNKSAAKAETKAEPADEDIF